MPRNTNKLFKNRLVIITLLLMLVALPVLSVPQAHAAAALNKTFVRFDRLQTSTATTGTVCATPTTIGSTEASVVVAFPPSYTLGLAATFTTNTTNLSWPTVAGFTTAAWPSIATATTVSSQNVTFPSGDLTSATTLYCFNWINSAAVTTSASATSSNLGSITTQTSAPVIIDTAQYTTATIGNDQIAVSASVPTSFSFSLGNTDNLGALTTSAVTPSPSPQSATVSTNAKNGWMVWAKDANTGLTSATAAYTIPSITPGTNSTLTTAAVGYNTGVTTSAGSGTGSLTVATPFVGGSLGKGGGLDTTLRTLASSNGPNGGATVTLTNNVAIVATTPAAPDYTDTITVVGAGLF